MDFTTYLAAAVIAAFSNHFHVTPGADEVTRLTGVAVDMYEESATGYVDADETVKLHLPFDGPAKREALALALYAIGFHESAFRAGGAGG